MPKMLIADDHYIVRTGLAFLLRTMFLQVEIDECRDGHGVWEKIQASDYDLLILDISMPFTDLFTLMKQILAVRPKQKILILTMSSEQIFARKYLQLGARGFINKEAPPTEITMAITNVLNNRRYISSRIRDTLTLEILDSPAKSLFDTLSERELEIMNYLIDGKNVSEIAKMLAIHISTVSTHKANILQKLGVPNIIELSKMVQMY
ncbi:MAG TPA: response regulator transcription factor [Puia sp.]|nr:response regulator transcription factor [Puia sp.]